MLKSILTPVFLFVFACTVSAQDLPLPPEVAAAYTKSTRAANGKPGKQYWQNRARYTIAVNLAPPTKLVTGAEQIVYFNNSPDTLRSLNMKLIMNMHRGGRTPNPEAGIQVDNIQANGTKISWDNTLASTTNHMLALAKPLPPRDSVKLDINWHYQLSNGRGREGFIDSTTFFLAYFYPRVSVYDDYKGWDLQPHTGGLEFYNDFNDYTLSVTVPKNYLVWATGVLRNAAQVLQPEFARRLQESMTSDSTIHIATAQDLASKNITAQNTTNTWTFTSTNITDVTFGVSNTYNWDAASVLVDDKARRRSSVQAAYPDSSLDFHRSVQNARYALGWFSHNLPGVPYPFPTMTAFQGYADMEYPMMVNDSHSKDLAFAQFVQDHEIAHTYFPFYMGINESRYAFMDEGWATTFEYLIGITERGQKAADDLYKSFRVSRWSRGAHTQENPVITPSPEVTFGSGNNSYGKPSLSYLALKDMLGDKLFKKALHQYMNNWNGKHPIPWDYFNAMNSGSGRSLNWFFNNWFYTKSYIDLNLATVTSTGTAKSLTIKNVGGFAVPFDVKVTYTDGTTASLHQTPLVWKDNQQEITVKLKTRKEVADITLDGGIFVDADAKNNVWKK